MRDNLQRWLPSVPLLLRAYIAPYTRTWSLFPLPRIWAGLLASFSQWNAEMTFWESEPTPKKTHILFPPLGVHPVSCWGSRDLATWRPLKERPWRIRSHLGCSSPQWARCMRGSKWDRRTTQLSSNQLTESWEIINYLYCKPLCLGEVCYAAMDIIQNSYFKNLIEDRLNLNRKYF